jgi:calcium-dependent protein kinase
MIRAAKMIPVFKVKQKDDMLKEFSILRELDHPNILKIFELYKDSKNYYMVTEYLEGGDLLEVI